METAMPRWATPARLGLLGRIAAQYVGKPGWKVDLMSGDFTHPEYQARVNDLISYWVADDRAQANAEWQAQRKRIHSLGEKETPLRGRFSGVSQTIYHESQPLYYLVGLGMSGLTLRPFAKVRLANSLINLHVDLGDVLQHLSKNKRRKVVRYGRKFSLLSDNRVSTMIHRAIVRLNTTTA